jgi:ankyrin repeat protein
MQGRRPLHWAAWSGKGKETVEALLARGADLAAKDTVGKTLLMRAVEAKHENIAGLLREAGAKE